MKQLIGIAFGLLLINNCFAQTLRPVLKKQETLKSTPVKKTNSAIRLQPGIDTAQKQPATTTTVAPVPAYYLLDAKVKLSTGDDNKEAPSGVRIELIKLSYIPGGAPKLEPLPGATLIYENRPPIGEYKSFSTNEITLVGIYSKDYGYGEIWLERVKAYGLKLRITYNPNFPLDAWKLNNVLLTLQLKDFNGNPHPYYGNVELLYTPNKLLKAGDNVVELFIDENLMKKL